MWNEFLAAFTTEHRRWIRIAIVGAMAALAYYFMESKVKDWLRA